MVVASNTGVRVLCTVVNGSCSNLQSAVVSPVVGCGSINAFTIANSLTRTSTWLSN